MYLIPATADLSASRRPDPKSSDTSTNGSPAIGNMTDWPDKFHVKISPLVIILTFRLGIIFIFTNVNYLNYGCS